jgi:hypothetical protein
MTTILRHRGTFTLVAGILIGFLLSSLVHMLAKPATAVAQSSAPDLAAMQADIAHLKEVIPSQSHSMTDVGYQFANLWFAGKQENWPLAQFFLNESRQHIAWTIRIRPIRKDLAGDPVDLQKIFDVISNGPLKNLAQSIQDKDEARFVVTYKQMLTGCYGCHLASGKPFLHPVVPQAPAQTIISFAAGTETSK